MKSTVFNAHIVSQIALLLTIVAVQGCQAQPLEPTATAISLILPTVYPSETPTPVPTRTPVPTLSPTPLPNFVLEEPCISYYDKTNGDLEFTCYRNRNWNIEIVDSEGDVGLYSSLAFNRFSEPSISYYSKTDQALKLARYDGKQWTVEVVTQEGDAGLFSSLAIGWDDTIYISYYDRGRGSIRIARKADENWTFEDVDEIGSPTSDAYIELFETSLVLDRNGNPIVSYVDLENQKLKLAWSDSEGLWSSQIVDRDSLVGWSSSLALTSDGVPIICYYDGRLQALKLAVLDGKEWKTSILDGSGDVGAYSSIALMQGGDVAVAYFDDDSDDIRYRDGQGLKSITTKSRIGWYLSMALDQTEIPWIAFYESSLGDLGYAKFENGRFRINYIVKSGEVGLYPSLKFVPIYETQ